MSYRRDSWKQFSYDLESFERSLKALRYAGAFDPPLPDIKETWEFHDLPTGALSLDQLPSILSATALAAPHGLQLLTPVPLPTLPGLPTRPTEPRPDWHRYTEEKAEKLEHRLSELRQSFETKYHTECEELNALRHDCIRGEATAICLLMKLAHVRHPFPVALHGPLDVHIDLGARIILCSVELPDFASLTVVRKRGASWKAKWSPVSVVERRRAAETILHSLCLRVAYLTASSDAGNWFDIIAINAKQKWHDPATGAPCEGVIASLQATKSDILQLRLNQVDPKVCFRHLKGLVTPSVEHVTAIRPIFVLDTEDKRIIESRDVADRLEEEANLAAMPWEDFEHLVRQLFEWEFGSNGVEVKVTRASRDRGVDAIMFDPDPLRGGKYVLQAKRYTRPVDVAAVRDLYGTVVNEGANRGILVTTSSYGPDSYEFAKDKPLSLVDGQNLIAMLNRHGRKFRIDLAEARRLEVESRAQ